MSHPQVILFEPPMVVTANQTETPPLLKRHHQSPVGVSLQRDVLKIVWAECDKEDEIIKGKEDQEDPYIVLDNSKHKDIITRETSDMVVKPSTPSGSFSKEVSSDQ